MSHLIRATRDTMRTVLRHQVRASSATIVLQYPLETVIGGGDVQEVPGAGGQGKGHGVIAVDNIATSNNTR